MKALSFLFLMATIFLTANAQATTRQWVLHETQPDGLIHVRVIQADAEALSNQAQISQDVVFEKTMTANEFSQFDTAHIGLKALVLPQTGAPLWTPIKMAWSQADEDAYSAWFAQNVNPDFLLGSNLSTDCADTGLLFRWVFAHDNRLPVANTLSGTGKLFGHFTSNAAWDNLPTNTDWKKDERFKAALHYLFQNSYTRTVVADLAPTFVTPQFVRPGSMFMIIRRSSGHTQSVFKVDPHAGITTVWGNEPASERIYKTPILIEFEQHLTFGVWREPRLNSASNWELTPATEMPGYSLEQFKQNFDEESDYEKWVDDRLDIKLTNVQKLSSMWMSLYVGVEQRLRVTAEGVFNCYYKQCSPSSADYDNFSTTSRDARLAKTQAQIIKLVAQVGDSDPDVKTWLASLGNDPFIPGTQINVLTLALDPSSMQGWNPDPRVSYAARWGLKDTSATDPNFDFFMSSSVVSQLMLDRIVLTLQHQGSVELDGQIEKMMGMMTRDRAATAFVPDSFSQVHMFFSKAQLYIPGAAICANNSCDENAVTWGADGSANVMANWSSAAGDDNPTRWGLAVAPPTPQPSNPPQARALSVKDSKDSARPHSS